MQTIKWNSLFLIVSLLALGVNAADWSHVPGTDFTFGPGPGDVYWEYMHIVKIPKKGSDWYIGRGYWFMESFEVDLPDLKHATRAEICVEYWGGHAGTSEQRFVVNGNEDEPVYYPLPLNTPSRPECYLRNMNGNSSSKLPLKLLKDGKNKFEFFHSDQICHSWGHPMTWAYAGFVRIYFDPEKVPHPQGEITEPVSGATVDDNPQFTATAQSKDGIKSVDFIGYYLDYDWEGNGIFRQWHYQTQKGVMKYHVGTKTTSPYQVTWNTKNTPDQPLPMKFMARIQDKKGIYYMTEAVTKIRLKRTSKSVKLGKPTQVPEKFWSGSSMKMSCKIQLPDNVNEADGATLIVPSWGARHSGEEGTSISINNRLVKKSFGLHHYFSYDQFPVNTGFIKNGSKLAEFTVYSATKHHPAEILWPGPALIIGFPTPDTTYCDTCESDSIPPSIERRASNPAPYTPFLSLAARSGRTVLLMEYQIPRKAHVTLTLQDVNGRTVRTVEDAAKRAGNYSRTIRTSSLAAGVYIARLVVRENGVLNTRIQRTALF